MALETNSFKMTLGNFLAFQLHHLFVKRRISVYIAFFSIFISLVCSTTSLYYFHSYLGFVTVTLTGFLILYYFYIYYVCPIISYLSAKKNGIYDREGRICINKDNLLYISSTTELKKTWIGIDSLYETKKIFFIYIDKANAFVIPKTAFNSPSDAGSFFQTAKLFFEISRGQSNDIL